MLLRIVVLFYSWNALLFVFAETSSAVDIIRPRAKRSDCDCCGGCCGCCGCCCCCGGGGGGLSIAFPIIIAPAAVGPGIPVIPAAAGGLLPAAGGALNSGALTALLAALASNGSLGAAKASAVEKRSVADKDENERILVPINLCKVDADCIDGAKCAAALGLRFCTCVPGKKFVKDACV